MKNHKFILFTVFILGLHGMTLGQSLKAEIASIDSYCNGVDALTKKGKKT